tara:strand:- start:1010 stop:1303 length:294 start_codon:yes stop_codon:yes gene_type:complete
MSFNSLNNSTIDIINALEETKKLAAEIREWQEGVDDDVAPRIIIGERRKRPAPMPPMSPFEDDDEADDGLSLHNMDDEDDEYGDDPFQGHAEEDLPG